MLAWQLLYLSAPPDPNQGLGYVALMLVGVAVVVSLLVTLIALVLHNLHEEEWRRRTH
jgi:CHASE1-domain containing sensor protein